MKSAKDQAGCGQLRGFVIKPLDPGCGPGLEVGPESLVLGRQDRLTSEKDANRCSRKQAVLTAQGNCVEVECCGQNPMEIHAVINTENRKDVPRKDPPIFRLKTGQRAQLQHGDVFSLVVGGCLLRVVRCKEVPETLIKSLDGSHSKLLPATIRPEGSKRVTARTSERVPRVCSSADAGGTERNGKRALEIKETICREEAQVCDSDPDFDEGKEQTVPLRRQGDSPAVALQQRTLHERGNSPERRGTDRRVDREVIPDSEDVDMQISNRGLGRHLPGTFKLLSREQNRPQGTPLGSSCELGNTLEDQSPKAVKAVLRKPKTRPEMGARLTNIAKPCEKTEDRPSPSKEPRMGISKGGCRDANISRWTFEMQETPLLLRSPAPSLPSRLQSTPAPKSFSGFPRDEQKAGAASASSSEDSKGSSSGEERRPQAGPRRHWSPENAPSKSDASCSSEDSEGSNSDGKRRPQAGVRKPWSPPKPPSSDREDDSSGSAEVEPPKRKLEERGRQKDRTKAAHGRDNSLSSDSESLEGRQRSGQAHSKHLWKRGLAGFAKKGESEEKMVFSKLDNAERKRPLSEDESPASSEDLLGIGQAERAGKKRKQKAAMRKSSSPETKEERRRLRKFGKSALKGRRVQGHSMLHLTTRALPGDPDGSEKPEVSEEGEGFGDLGAWEDVEMSFEEPRVNLARKPNGKDRSELPKRPNNRMGLPVRQMERCTSPDRPIERGLSLDRPMERGTSPDRPMETIGRPKVNSLQSLCITSTGYRGAQKKKLQEIVSSMGAKYTGELTPKHTHLVCNDFSGGKFRRAVEWGIPRVNHAWLQDCAWRNEVLSEEGYCEKAGKDIAPLPESQPCSSPVELFAFPQPPANESAPAVASERTGSGLSEESQSDGQEGMEPQSDGHAKGWIPPPPHLSDDSEPDFDEWKKRRGFQAKSEDSICVELEEEFASSKGRKQEGKRLGGGKAKEFGKGKAEKCERNERKRFRRKSSVSGDSASEEELGKGRPIENQKRSIQEKAGSGFRIGGRVYEERGPAREYDTDEIEGVSDDRRPLKRLKKLRLGAESKTRRHKDSRKQEESCRKEGPAERGWEGFDPKDWVDWNDRSTDAGDDIEGQPDLEEQAQVRRESRQKFEAREKSGLWETSFEPLRRSGVQALQSKLPAQRGSEEQLRIGQVCAREPLDGHVSRAQPLDGHVSHSQRSSWGNERPSFGSLPCSEHPVHLPGRTSQQEERPRPSDEFHRTSQDRPRGSPGVRQKSLESVWAKAGVSLRDDLPVRKKRRAERVQGLAPLARTPPVKIRTPEQSKIALAMMKSPSPGGETACVICLATRVNAVQGVLPCGHEFCYSCVMSWAAVKADSKRECPLCKTPYDIITKRHVAGSDGVSPEDEVVPLGVGPGQQVGDQGPVCMYCKGGTAADLLLSCSGCETGAAHTFCLDPPLMIVPQEPWYCERCERRRATRAAYDRKGAGRRSNGLGERRQRSNGPRESAPAVPAGGIDPSFGRFLSGQQPSAAENLRRTLPTRSSR